MDIRELENMATQIQALKNVQRLQQIQINILVKESTTRLEPGIPEGEEKHGLKWARYEDDIVILEFETAIRRAARKLGRSQNAIRARLNRLRDMYHRRMKGEW